MNPKLAEHRDDNGNCEDQPNRSFDAYSLHHHTGYRVHFHAYALNLSLRRYAVKEFGDYNRCRYHVCDVFYHASAEILRLPPLGPNIWCGFASSSVIARLIFLLILLTVWVRSSSCIHQRSSTALIATLRSL